MSNPLITGETDGQFTVSDGDDEVEIGVFRSKRGERIEIQWENERIRLDALILESISWQRSRDDLAEILDDGDLVLADATPISGGDPIESSPVFYIANEYTQVRLRHLKTDDGEVLEVQTPTRASETNLGVSTLKALATHEDTFAFSEFFRTPVGPEDTPIEGPH